MSDTALNARSFDRVRRQVMSFQEADEFATEVERLIVENQVLRDAIHDIYRAWCDDDILDEHGIDESFGGRIVHAAMVAHVYRHRDILAEARKAHRATLDRLKDL